MVAFMANEPEKLFIQSGVLPLTSDGVLLITARRSGRWIIPKGHVESGMSPAESAAKEGWEEAGVIGRIGHESIGIYRYRRPSGIYSVQVFPLEVESVLDEWPEMHLRQRRIVSRDEAAGLFTHDELRTLVVGFFGRRFGV
jgi:8-oxo-dGTP pyrophosphatase MutT (NUDIX family)